MCVTMCVCGLQYNTWCVIICHHYSTVVTILQAIKCQVICGLCAPVYHLCYLLYCVHCMRVCLLSGLSVSHRPHNISCSEPDSIAAITSHLRALSYVTPCSELLSHTNRFSFSPSAFTHNLPVHWQLVFYASKRHIKNQRLSVLATMPR